MVKHLISAKWTFLSSSRTGTCHRNIDTLGSNTLYSTRHVSFAYEFIFRYAWKLCDSIIQSYEMVFVLINAYFGYVCVCNTRDLWRLNQNMCHFRFYNARKREREIDTVFAYCQILYIRFTMLQLRADLNINLISLLSSWNYQKFNVLFLLRTISHAYNAFNSTNHTRTHAYTHQPIPNMYPKKSFWGRELTNATI